MSYVDVIEIHDNGDGTYEVDDQTIEAKSLNTYLAENYSGEYKLTFSKLEPVQKFTVCLSFTIDPDESTIPENKDAWSELIENGFYPEDREKLEVISFEKA